MEFYTPRGVSVGGAHYGVGFILGVELNHSQQCRKIEIGRRSKFYAGGLNTFAENDFRDFFFSSFML